MIKKLNLVIDGNYLFMRGVFILKDSRTIDTDLVPLLARDIKKMTDLYNFDNIYFCSDSGTSWRKEFLDIEYKANREKDKTIDWDMCFREYTDFKNQLSNVKGIDVLEYKKLEGDDIISYLVRKGNKLGISNLIVSRDEDIQQDIEFSLSEGFINIIWNYNKKCEKLFVPKNFEVFKDRMTKSVDESSIFDINYDHDVLDMIENITKSAAVIQVDGEEIAFCKLVSGDKGDNIKGIVKLKKGVLDPTGRGYGKAGATKVYIKYKTLYPEPINFNTYLFCERCVHLCAITKKITDNNIKEHMLGNIKANIRLVLLDDINLPSDLLQLLDREVYPLITREKVSVVDDSDFWFNGGTEQKIITNENSYTTLAKIINPNINKDAYSTWQNKQKNVTKEVDTFFVDEEPTDTSGEEVDFWNI